MVASDEFSISLARSTIDSVTSKRFANEKTKVKDRKRHLQTLYDIRGKRQIQDVLKRWTETVQTVRRLKQ